VRALCESNKRVVNKIKNEGQEEARHAGVANLKVQRRSAEEGQPQNARYSTARLLDEIIHDDA